MEQRWIRCEKCGWNYTLDEQDVKRYSVCPNCSKRATNPARGKYYIPDATLTTKTGKKIPIEIKLQQQLMQKAAKRQSMDDMLASRYTRALEWHQTAKKK